MSIEKHIQAVDQRIKQQGEYVDNLPPVNEFDHGRLISEQETVPPHGDIDNIGVRDIVKNRNTKPRRWLINELIPLGKVSLLAAVGGTGKSFLTLQMAISVAAGVPFMGMDVGEPGGVLMIAAEDEREELDRRLVDILDQMEYDGELDEEENEKICDRLFLNSTVDIDNLMTREQDRTLTQTEVNQRIKVMVDRIQQPINLIILDPVSRFRGGDENDNEAATRFIESVEWLKSATGATVLMPHHLNKGAQAAGTKSLSIEHLRGASGLVDGARWAGAMATMRSDEAEDYGVDPEDAGYYVRFECVKNSYASPWSGTWLKRINGGVLVPTEIETQETKKEKRKGQKAAKDEAFFYNVATKLKEVVREAQNKNDPLTNNRLCKRLGNGQFFGIGDKRLRNMIERAVQESYLYVEYPQGGRYAVFKTQY